MTLHKASSLIPLPQACSKLDCFHHVVPKFHRVDPGIVDQRADNIQFRHQSCSLTPATLWEIDGRTNPRSLACGTHSLQCPRIVRLDSCSCNRKISIWSSQFPETSSKPLSCGCVVSVTLTVITTSSCGILFQSQGDRRVNQGKLISIKFKSMAL